MIKINRRLSKMDLDDIFYIARQHLIDDTHIKTIDDQQFRTQCFTKAVCMLLHIDGVEYPEQIQCEPIDD